MPLMLVFNGMEADTQTWYLDLDTGGIVQILPGTQVPVRKVNDYAQYVAQGVAVVTGDEDGSDGRLDQITDAIRAVMVAVAPLEGDSSAWTLSDMLNAIAVVQQEDDDSLEAWAARPEVTATTPADGATDVELDAVISVTFSKQMAAETLIASNFTLNPVGGGTPAVRVASISTSLGNTHVVFHLDVDTPLVNDAVYKINVKRGVHDLAGQSTLEGSQGDGHSGYTSPTGFHTTE